MNCGLKGVTTPLDCVFMRDVLAKVLIKCNNTFPNLKRGQKCKAGSHKLHNQYGMVRLARDKFGKTSWGGIKESEPRHLEQIPWAAP